MRHEREPRRTNGFLNFLDGVLSFALLMLVMVAALGMWVHTGFDAKGPLTQQAVVVVPKGDSALEVADRLERAGVIDDRRLFMLQYYVGKVYGGATAGDRGGLKAGEYEFKPGASVRQVLDTIISGRGILLKLTVPEGLTSQQIVERIKAEPGLTGEIAQMPNEGTLLPDTYRFSRGTSRQEIVDRMRADHGKLIAALWAQRQEELPFKTLQDALTLASIVEKETGKAEERPAGCLRLHQPAAQRYAAAVGSDHRLWARRRAGAARAVADALRYQFARRPTTPTRSMACHRGRSATRVGRQSLPSSIRS